MSGGFLKHGMIVLIDAHTYSLAFLPTTDEPALLQATLTNIQEIRARGGLVVEVHQHENLDRRTDAGLLYGPGPRRLSENYGWSKFDLSECPRINDR